MSTRRQRDRLLAPLPPVADCIRGSLIRDSHEGCRCHPHGRYGPSWDLSVNQGGRMKMRKLSADQVLRVREAIRHYQQWGKTGLRIFELPTELALSEED